MLANEKTISNIFEIKCSRCGIINSIFKTTTDQVIITDVDGNILYVNSMLEQTTGYSLQEVIGQKPSLWGNQMSKQFYKKMWHKIKDVKQPIDVVIKNKKKNGDLYEARLVISPVFDSNGNIKFFVGTESIIN